MITISDEFKRKVATALLAARENWTGFDTTFAHRYGINVSVFNRIKSGEIDGLLKETKWLNLGHELGVKLNDREWNIARTDVFNTIEDDIIFCQENAKARIFVDECGIGKTFAAKYLSRTRKNCIYIDASQSKTKLAFVRSLAKSIGVDHNDKYLEVLSSVKFALNAIIKPIVIVDEAGDLEYTAFLELKELWNATEGNCGWYMIGADGLQKQIEKGIRNKKVGYREIFSRFSESYSSTVPKNKEERNEFYIKLINDVLSVNMADKKELPAIVKKCMTSNVDAYQLGGLRRAESILLLTEQSKEQERAMV